MLVSAPTDKELYQSLTWMMESNLDSEEAPEMYFVVGDEDADGRRVEGTQPVTSVSMCVLLASVRSVAWWLSPSLPLSKLLSVSHSHNLASRTRTHSCCTCACCACSVQIERWCWRKHDGVG